MERALLVLAGMELQVDSQTFTPEACWEVPGLPPLLNSRRGNLVPPKMQFSMIPNMQRNTTARNTPCFNESACCMRGVGARSCKTMLWRTPRELHGRGAIFMARSWRGPGEIKILQGRSACKTQTNPRNPRERLRGVEPARHCKGGRGRWTLIRDSWIVSHHHQKPL